LSNKIQALNKKPRRVALNDQLVTDERGRQQFVELRDELEKLEIPKRNRYYAVLQLLKALKAERRLWRVDGSIID
jgi:hypothetical protein